MTAIPDEDLHKYGDRLKDAVVFITGAGSGIGRETALKVAGHGAKVVITDINLKGAEETLDLIKQAGGSALAVKSDVTSWEDQLAAFEAAIAEFGKVDVIIANAGVGELGRFLGAPAGEDGKPVKPDLSTLEINLTGVLYTIHLAQYYLFKDGPPQPGSLKSIVAISSMAAWQAIPGGVLYSTSKLGVLGAIRSVGKPLANIGVRASVVHPFFADTPILGSARRGLIEGLPLANVERIASAIVYAATDPDLTTYASALVIPDDGGVYQLENERLKQGVYAEIEARINKLSGFKI